MARILISYRRDDSSAHAGRIYDRLVSSFGADSVFMDIDNIEPGEDFVEVLERALDSADVLLAMIGPKWTDITDARGNRRLDDPNDFVRLEIATALRRNIRVVPVLVGGAMLPSAGELPDDLEGLLRRQAHEVTDTRFHTDVERLEKHLAPVGSATSLRKPVWIALAAVVLFIAGVTYLWPTLTPTAVPPPGEPSVAEETATVGATASEQANLKAEQQRLAEEVARLAELEQKRKETEEQQRELESESVVLWAAVVSGKVGDDTGFYSFWRADNAERAEEPAMRRCRKNATGCAVEAAAFSNCFSLARRSPDGWGWATRDSVLDAVSEAIRLCNERFSPCKQSMTFCADGSEHYVESR